MTEVPARVFAAALRFFKLSASAAEHGSERTALRGAARARLLTERRMAAAPLERHVPLPRPDELRFERGADGLIELVNGRSVHDFVGDLTYARAKEYRLRRVARTDLAFSDQKADRSSPYS